VTALPNDAEIVPKPVRKPVIQNPAGKPRALIQEALGIRVTTPTSPPNDKMTPEVASNHLVEDPLHLIE